MKPIRAWLRPPIPALRSRRAALLDRDGVLNPSPVRGGRPRAPLTLEEFVPFPWVAEAIVGLHGLGFVCLVVTNQPDVGAGELDPRALDAMHARLLRETGIDAVYACPHTAEDRCDCRKPRAGLLRAAAADWDVDLLASFMIGDRASDIEAGRAAGCVTILVDGPEHGTPEPHYRARDLRSAIEIIRILTREANETFRRLCQPV